MFGCLTSYDAECNALTESPSHEHFKAACGSAKDESGGQLGSGCSIPSSG